MENFYDNYHNYLNLFFAAIRMQDAYLANRASQKLKQIESSIPMRFKPTGNYYNPLQDTYRTVGNYQSQIEKQIKTQPVTDMTSIFR